MNLRAPSTISVTFLRVSMSIGFASSASSVCSKVFILDILANELSIDVWNSAWDEQRKRRWIKRAIPLHRIKGTLAAIREYLEQAGGEIVRVIRPPEGFVLADSQTPEDYERWVRTLPQVRIYQDRVSSTLGPFLACEIGAFDLDALDDLPDPLETGRKAVFWRNGVETPVGVDDSGGMASLTVALRIPLKAFGALGFDEGCLAGPDDLAPIYRMGVSFDQTLALNPVSPGVRMQIVSAETVSETLIAIGAFGDLGVLDVDYFADELVSLVYYRIPIIDGRRLLDRRRRAGYSCRRHRCATDDQDGRLLDRA